MQWYWPVALLYCKLTVQLDFSLDPEAVELGLKYPRDPSVYLLAPLQHLYDAGIPNSLVFIVILDTLVLLAVLNIARVWLFPTIIIISEIVIAVLLESLAVKYDGNEFKIADIEDSRLYDNIIMLNDAGDDF